MAALVMVRAAVYLALGPGLILDDWTAAGNREFLGILSIADQTRLMSRPLEWLTYTVVYGVGGNSPVVLFLEVTLLNLVAVTALLLLLRRYFSPTTAWIVCAAWVLVPNHNAMTVWAANTQSLVAFTLLAAGVVALSRGSRVAAALLLGLSVLGYQVTIVPAFAAVALVGTRFMPLTPEAAPPARKLEMRDRLLIGVPVLLCVAWTAIEPTYPFRLATRRPWRFLNGHFAEGLFSQSVPPAVVVLCGIAAVAGVIAAIELYRRGERARNGGPTLVLVGIGVIVVGSFGSLLTPVQPFGMIDRLYAISSVGAVMVWVGIAKMLFSRRAVVGLAFALLWAGICLYGQAVSLASWSQAGDDVVALMGFLDESGVDPSAALVVGPEAVRHNNVVGIVSPHAPDNALWLHRDEMTGSLRIAKTPEEFVVQTDGEILITWPD
ncbi:MAG: hypothetical protein KDB35_22035 [Acidimicrobiales bacterium]|nr:hypothetical protein [Acidimicrobiales bacterium]MCB9374007.1 hypothetical protein [Microthrixaceae bacterium]